MADNIFAVTVPKWGIEMQEGTIVTWHFNEGDAVTKGEELIDIETDKIVNTMEAPSDGLLRRRIVEEGETLNVGALLGVIAGADADDGAIDTFISEFKPADASFAFDDDATESAPVEAAPVVEAKESSPSQPTEKPRVSPAAARRAKELNVDISKVTGTGRGGRISSEDIERYAQENAATPTVDSDANYEVVPMSAMRKMISRKLVEAKQTIPHFYLTTEIEMDQALAHRQTVNEASEQKVSVNDLLVRACVLALQEIPEVNINVQNDEIHLFKNVNIAIAVATEDGLVTPVLHQAENLSLTEVAAKTKDLSTRARSKTLVATEMRHGSFTVSNLGMFGVSEFQGIINPPQGALLAAGGVSRQLLPADGGTREASVMKVSLSCDHRAIDGALGAKFLQQLKAIMENPTDL